MGRARIARIALSMTHDATQASAVAVAERATMPVTAFDRLAWRCLPARRAVVLENLRRVYGEHVGEDEILRIAQAHYGHLARLVGEFLRYRFLSAKRKDAIVRVENLDLIRAVHARGKGVLIVTGHFGNFEVATLAGVRKFPEAHGRFHFVRRAIKPAWLEALVTRRFTRAGFGVLPKRGSLDALVERLEAGDLVVFPFDQHAQGRDGVPVEFFGHAAGTFKSLAIIAVATGAPIMPASAWREPDGTHVLRFEEPLELPRSDERRTRNCGSSRAPATPRSSASSCAGPSSGGGCTGAGRAGRLSAGPAGGAATPNRPARGPEGALVPRRRPGARRASDPGAPKTNRTSDLPLRRGLLYPLSYRGVRRDSTGAGARAAPAGRSPRCSVARRRRGALHSRRPPPPPAIAWTSCKACCCRSRRSTWLRWSFFLAALVRLQLLRRPRDAERARPARADAPEPRSNGRGRWSCATSG